METRRLKNIAILILLLLNIFLLLLLGYQYLQSRRSYNVAAEQLQLLFAADQITLAPEADLFQEPLQPITLERNTEQESAMAAFLLGQEVPFLSQGGGIHSYTADSGAIHFRSGGSFDSSSLSLPVANVIGYAQDFFKTFGFVQTENHLIGSSGTISAVQQIRGIYVTDCSVMLTFENGILTAVSGSHVSLENTVDISQEDQLSCITALARFLDHLRDSGMISRQVEDVFCIYKLESTASVLRLLPIWQIETDTYTYLVDCSNGEVTRQS